VPPHRCGILTADGRQLLQELIDNLPTAPELLQNSLWLWGLAAAGSLLVYLALRLGLAYGRRQLTRLAERAVNQVDDLVLELVDHTHGLFLFALGVVIGCRFLTLSEAASTVVHRAHRVEDDTGA
jgi:hypothetical protein